MNKHSKKAERVLGIAATPRAVHAVLLQDGPDGPQVVRRFSRQRSIVPSGFEEAAPKSAARDTPTYGGTDDFTIEFGEGGSNANLFLASEFGGVDTEVSDEVSPVANYELELSDILAESNDAGFGDASLAFVLGVTDVVFIEIRVSSKKQKRPDHATLIDALTEQYKGIFDDERVAFLPMTQASDGERRYLAVFTKGVDAASATLTAIRDSNERIPHVKLIDAEIPVLVGLSRVATNTFKADAPEDVEAPADEEADDGSEEEPRPATRSGVVNTLVVRAGIDETLVLFMHGDTIHHCESLRSLTAFDAPETICSRVLLQQDEHAVGDVHHVLVLSEERESELTDTFGMFFPDASVEPIRLYVPGIGNDGEDAATGVVSAIGVALRALDDPYYAPAFEDVNFLPKKLLRRKVRLPITWNVVVMSMLIVVTSIFFMARYTSAETEITSYKDRLEKVAPGTLAEDISVLQARIDSMQHLYATYTRALEVLDTLLVGSDRWSRLLERTSTEASRVKGLWIDTFSPEASAILITGTATSRDHVVAFASRLSGSIESLTFSEIREFPVYTYTMKVPVEDSLPEAARYLRNQVKLGDRRAKSAQTATRMEAAQ
jgi:hypothetical protein